MISYFCASPPALAASICIRVRFEGTLTHPPATQINSVRCQTSMLTHGGSTFTSYTEGGKPTDALGLETPPQFPPIRCRPDSPLCCDKRRAGTFTTRLLCLFTFRIMPSSSWTVHRCTLLCFLPNRISMRVVRGPVWLTRAHICVHTHFHSTFPSVPEVPFALPPTSN